MRKERRARLTGAQLRNRVITDLFDLAGEFDVGHIRLARETGLFVVAPATADLMNKLFINIKVDREERPDLDQIYMAYVQSANQGRGGWPMSVFLTPELKPDRKSTRLNSSH